MFEHVADSEQTSVECLEGPDGSYLVASPFLISCLHWKPLRVQHLQERQPYNSSSLASKSSWKRFKSSAFPFFFYCFQILGMWCFHHLTRSWCSNWIFVVFVCILCSFYSVAQQATYTVQACAGLSGRIKAVGLPLHPFTVSTSSWK